MDGETPVDGPLAAAVLEQIEQRLLSLDALMTPERAARRLYELADMLQGPRPPSELFICAAAVALMGAYKARRFRTVIR